MKVLLLEDVRGQGKKGEIVNVSDGYARNFLLPQKKAVEANNSILNEIKAQAEKKKRVEEQEKSSAAAIAEKLMGVELKIPMSAGSDGKLYGGVTNIHIAELLKEKYGIDIDKRKIVIDEPIKAYGAYKVTAKLYPEITGTINIIVTEK